MTNTRKDINRTRASEAHVSRTPNDGDRGIMTIALRAPSTHPSSSVLLRVTLINNIKHNCAEKQHQRCCRSSGEHFHVLEHKLCFPGLCTDAGPKVTQKKNTLTIVSNAITTPEVRSIAIQTRTTPTTSTPAAAAPPPVREGKRMLGV